MITKLGSLFDGSGGFPLAGALCGIEPIWASEIEPYPIAVTKSRLPKMKHLGDISKINGAEIEPVDIITFGSPCQDLSVAGKRAGLKHQSHGDGETTRSGLFMEAVRIIKEMREKTNGKYPRFALWENVPGAFSSNKGEDFRVVLEEIIKITEPNAVMPQVPQKGWAYADSYCGDGWSIAYRVLDAQYWGVPQRRRRIYLVADFGGGCAREILFEREGLRGYFTQGRTPWQRITTDVERGVGADDQERAYGVVTKGNGDAFVSNERHTSLSTGGGQAGQGYPCTMQPIAVATQQGGAEINENGICPTVTAAAGMSGNNQPWITHIIDNIGGQAEYAKASDVNGTLRAGTQGAIAYVLENYPNDSRVKVDKSGKVQALTGRMGTGGGNVPMVLEVKNYIDVEMEVATRKYEVDCKLLSQCLRDHKATSKLSNKKIAEILDRPLTLVEHWFRQDKHFAIPEPDVWFELKKLLGIETTEFDRSIMEFEYKGGNYDMRNRIYIGDTSPTLTCDNGSRLYLLPNVEEKSKIINLNKGDVQSKTVLDPSGIAPPLYAGECRGGGGECYVMEPTLFENHGQDARFTGPLDVAPTAQAGYGEGGSTKPLVVEQIPFCKSRRAKNPEDFTTWKYGKVANTLNTFDQGEVRTNELIVETVTLEGNGQRPSHQGDGYSVTDKSYTLNATEKHGVVYAVDQGGGKSQANVSEDMSPTLTCTHGGEPAIAIDRAFFNQGKNALYAPQTYEDGTAPTLVAKGPGAVCEPIPKEVLDFVSENNADAPHQQDLLQTTDGVCRTIAPGTHAAGSHLTKTIINMGRHYIVRRLTPTECARLQGFPDCWGDIDNKGDLTDEEYKFWLDVRNNHAVINGKKTKEYTKAQVLAWYKKLHTDSAEYKMWGNGIALPTALYVMQGIKEVSNESYKD